jgi:hypothetical protein
VTWLAVVGISVDIEDLTELEIVSKRVADIVDSSDCATELVMDVEPLGSIVEISGKFDVVISFSSVDNIIFVSKVIRLVLVPGPSLVISILSVVTSFVSDRIVENVDGLFEFISVVSV